MADGCAKVHVLSVGGVLKFKFFDIKLILKVELLIVLLLVLSESTSGEF